MKGESVGCVTCKSVITLGAYKSQGLKISQECVGVNVKPFGTNKQERQQSMRKKIFDHKSSKTHSSACAILESAKLKSIEVSNAKSIKIDHETTSRVFRTAYQSAGQAREADDRSSTFS